MPNRNYLKGIRFERQRQRAWEMKGYAVLRTAGSRGAFDLIAVKHNAPVELIQCKSTRGGETTARRLVTQFKLEHPFVDSRYFHQTIEIWSGSLRQLFTGTV